MTPNELTSALSAPFPGTAISWRVGAIMPDKSKGLALAYIDARDVMTRLDDVCGPAGWQCRYPHTGKHVVCEIGIRIDGEWIWKANGAGDTDVEAVKGGLSDSLKRAAVVWGIGRYLYDLPSPWVKLKKERKSYIIDPSEVAGLAKLANGGRYSPPPQGQQRKDASSAKSKSQSRDTYSRLSQAIRDKETPLDLEMWLDDPRVKSARASLPPDWQRDLSNEITQHQHALQDRMARV